MCSINSFVTLKSANGHAATGPGLAKLTVVHECQSHSKMEYIQRATWKLPCHLVCTVSKLCKLAHTLVHFAVALVKTIGINFHLTMYPFVGESCRTHIWSMHALVEVHYSR